MCRKLQESLHDNHETARFQHSVADYDTLEKVLELDQKLSNLLAAMMDCRTCSSDPLRTTALLRELDVLCTVYVAEQAKFATPDHRKSGDGGDGRAEVGSSTFLIGRFELDSEECKLVGRVIVKQGLEHIQKNLQKVQVEQKRAEGGALQDEIDAKVRKILSKVWKASASECL